MDKLIKVAQRIAPKFKSKDLMDIYYSMISDKFLNQIAQSVGPDAFIKLCFLIKAYKEGRALDDMAERLETDLFVFSIIEVSPDDPEVECGECNGEGEYRCQNCSGSGNVECGDCGGSGEDEEGDSCYHCDGDGEVGCGDCDGTGTEQCYYCDGSGYMNRDDKTDYNVKYYVSIEKEVFNNLELLENHEEISQDEIRFLKLKGNTLFIDNENFYGEDAFTDEKGTNLFGEMSKELEFRFLNSGRVRPLYLDY